MFLASQPEQELGKIRTFLSLNLNQEDIDPLERDQNALKAIIGTENVRWEDPGKFHMTLRFLGDVDTAKVNAMADIFERLKFDFETIEYHTDKMGFFRIQNIRMLFMPDLKRMGTI